MEDVKERARSKPDHAAPYSELSSGLLVLFLGRSDAQNFAQILDLIRLALGSLANLVKLGTDSTLAAEYVTSDPPWKDLSELVSGVGASRHTEDVVELLEGSLLGLGQEQEDQNKGNDIQSSIEAESTLSSECSQHVRER